MRMTQRTVAVVPLRSPGAGKTRLAGALSPRERAALAAAMLTDVVAALRSAEVDEVVLAAGGPGAVTAATALGVSCLPDPVGAADLNEALGAATDRFAPASDVLVVVADLPRITGQDVLAVLAADAEVVVAPNRGGGTAALLRRPGDRIPTAFGPASAQRHLDLATAHGATTAVVARRRLHCDVDTLDDVRALGHGPVGTATAAVLGGFDHRGVREAR